jgi:hypothetical protein
MKFLLYTIISLLFIFTVWQYYAASSNKKYNSMNNKIIGTIDNIEFRIYNQYTKASVPISNSNMKSANGKFSILAGYIFGGNQQKKSIAMTSPVIYEMEEKSYFSFLMPESLTVQELPKPNNNSIEINDVVNQHVAVISFGGFANDNKVKKYHAQLKNKLIDLGLKVDNNHIVAVYQPPYQFIDRTNEIWIEISKNDLDGLLSSIKMKEN